MSNIISIDAERDLLATDIRFLYKFIEL